eukprot:scaffold22337_cov112-Isochrysis_galbana.AAC.7
MAPGPAFRPGPKMRRSETAIAFERALLCLPPPLTAALRSRACGAPIPEWPRPPASCPRAIPGRCRPPARRPAPACTRSPCRWECSRRCRAPLSWLGRRTRSRQRPCPS